MIAVVVLFLGLIGCSSHPSTKAAAPSSTPPLGLRPLPSFLPSTSESVDGIVTAAPGQPQLAVQGLAVLVRLPSAHVLAVITGPHVPPFVTPPPPTVAATFDVSFSKAVGEIPIRLTDFTITDQDGRTLHPSLVAHAAKPPATVASRGATTFQVTAVMPTGEGRIYWSPTGGSPLVGWDFIVEND